MILRRIVIFRLLFYSSVIVVVGTMMSTSKTESKSPKFLSIDFSNIRRRAERNTEPLHDAQHVTRPAVQIIRSD